MEDPPLHLLAARLEHETLTCALSQVAHHSLSELFAYIDSGKLHAKALRRLRVCDLLRVSGAPFPIDLELLQRARGADGASFDRLVLQVLQYAYPQKVDASYLRERLGGPRWKLQHSLIRLVKAQRVVRIGRTSDTRYAALSREP